MSDMPLHKTEEGEELDRLRAELAEKTAALQRESLGASNLAVLLKATEKERDEARRLLDEARKQEPVAWAYHFSLHAHHDDFFDNEAFSDVLLKRRRELSPDDAFGRRGRDFDEKALITEVPLYAAPVPAQPAELPPEIAGDIRPDDYISPRLAAALEIPAFLRRDQPETGKLPCKYCGTGYVPAQPAVPDDVAKDALKQVRRFLSDFLKDEEYDHPAAGWIDQIDAILSATEGRKDE